MIQEGIFSSVKLPKGIVEFCIVSDIHIANDDSGKSKGRNDYVFAENKQTPVSGEAYTLKRFCEKVTKSGRDGCFSDDQHILVLLGDVINGECGYFASYHSVAYKMLFDSFSQWVHTGNILYIPGNHDKEAKFYSSLTGFPRLSIIETIESGSKKNKLFTKCGIIFEHGHKFDFLCSGKNFLGMFGDFASNAVVKMFSPDTEDLMRGREFYYDHSDENKMRDLKSIPSQVKISSMSNENKRVANGALNLLYKNSSLKLDNPCHTIVCGHTHQSPVRISGVYEGNKLTYFNTGKFAKDGYLSIKVKKMITRSGKEIWSLVE